MSDGPFTQVCHSTTAIKRLYDIQLGKMLQNDSGSLADSLVPYFKAKHVLWDGVISTDLPKMWASPRDLTKYQVRSGDLLVSEGGDVGRAAILEDAPTPSVIQNALHRVRSETSDVRFLCYALRAIHGSGWLDVVCNKATIAHLTGEKLGELHIPSSPLPTQKAIADFLDKKTAAIDALIEKKQKLLTLLAEKRAALINQAVTKGLDPNVPMKDSGIPWIGEIPAHWELRVKLQSLTGTRRGSFVNGPFGSDLLAEELTQEGVPVVYIRDIKPLGYRRKSTVCVTAEKAAQLDVCRVDPGDVLVAKVGSPPGDACVYPRNEPAGIVTQDVIRLKLLPAFDAEYVALFLNSDAGREIVAPIIVESTRARVGLGEYKRLRIPLPPLDEQRTIISGLRTRLTNNETATSKLLEQVTKLQEYRQALITAAVTGQLDIGEAA